MEWLDDSIHTRKRGKFTSDNPNVVPDVLYVVWFYPDKSKLPPEVEVPTHRPTLEDIFEGSRERVFEEMARREQSGRPVKIVNWIPATPDPAATFTKR